MRKALIRSVCECQADLEAVLDEERLVLEAWAVKARSRELAPAHTMNPDHPHFDVGWLCPFCGRNTLRSFEASGLVYRETAATEATQGTSGQPTG